MGKAIVVLALMLGSASGCKGDSEPCPCRNESRAQPFEIRAPTNSTMASGQSRTLVVRIGKDGSIYYLGELTTRANLSKLFREEAQDPSLRVIVSAGKDVPFGHVVAALDALRFAGVKRHALNLEK